MKRLTGRFGFLLFLLLQGCELATSQLNGERGYHREGYELPRSADSIEGWLEKRHKLCMLPVAELRVRYESLTETENIAKPKKNEQMEKLLITTCNPNMTPGLLRNELSNIMSQRSWSDSEQHLLELIRDFNRSNTLLEEERRRLTKELESTINGIKDIESDIDNIDPSGAAP